jgi:hypothetical protein
VDKDIILTLIVSITQLGLAWMGTKIHSGVKAVRRQQSAHNLYLCQVRDRLDGWNIPGLPNMRQAQDTFGVARHERT